MNLRVLASEKFSCHSCTNCCRIWQVELLPGEPERAENLAWPAGDPLIGIEPLARHGGKTYLAHRPDGACVFLNEANGRCRIHEQFGEPTKPLGCRLYPFQIAPTFPGEMTVIARYDCPTVRKNQGQPHADALPELRQLASKIELGPSFDDALCCHLDRQQLQAVSDFLLSLTNAFAGDAERAMFISYTCDWLAGLNNDELTRQVLAEAFSPLKQLVEAASAEGRRRRPGLLMRASFRTLLGLYLRRDEDVVDRRAGRLGRAMTMLAVVLGGGNLHRLGLIHPQGRLRAARLFGDGPQAADGQTFALFWRLVRSRIESFQFMGQGNAGRDFLSGLRSLALLYPLVHAAAQYHASCRGGETIEAIDVDYSANVIEHSFGRLAVLRQGFVGRIESLLLDPMAFARLVTWV